MAAGRWKAQTCKRSRKPVVRCWLAAIVFASAFSTFVESAEIRICNKSGLAKKKTTELRTRDLNREKKDNRLRIPVPGEWVWSPVLDVTANHAYLSKQFTIDKALQKATVHIAADFCHARLRLNGNDVALVEDYSPLVRIDVTRFMRRGANEFAVVCRSGDGPSAIALVLELAFNNGTRSVIATNQSWRVISKNPESNLQSSNITKAISFGKLSFEPWFRLDNDIAIGEIDDYTQWKQALSQESGADPAMFRMAPGFEIELLRSARKDEGSWIGLAFDPNGRLVISREDKGLLRLTLPTGTDTAIQVTTINNTLLECRGLLFAHGSLYANANNSKALYRLRDTNGDDQFDEVKRLYESGGSVGHGRNDLALGPDGLIYSIHGDAVDMPTNARDRTSPFGEHRRNIKTREGHVMRMDRDGNNLELVLGGLRNPYGIDFNIDGEMFTYDADAEFDMGAPWYRPTRVMHLVSGTDYGWRGVTGKWPPYYPDHPDNARPVFDVGKGSPTAVKFGTDSNFPAHYKKALFILDWAYGRIMAIHMSPRGASYICGAETFAKGRPFNVTDLAFGPDGAMYVVTGGRKTQSGLYRIRYVGSSMNPIPETIQQKKCREFSSRLRAIRRSLEAYHGKQDSNAIEAAWPYLGHSDPSVRYAARIAIEHQPISEWQNRALVIDDVTASLTILMTLSQTASPGILPRILSRLNSFSFSTLSTSDKLAALHAYSNCLSRLKTPDSEVAAKAIARMNRAYPDSQFTVNQELCKILSDHHSKSFVTKTITLLESTDRQAEKLHYLFALRNVKQGWTIKLRRKYLEHLAATRYYQGGDGLPKFIDQIKAEALATLSDDEKSLLVASLKQLENSTRAEEFTDLKRSFVREWSIADLNSEFGKFDRGRNFENGKSMFRAALCVRCHRILGEGHTTGPDLTSVARRFSRGDILESIVNPSKIVAEKYRNAQIVTTSGKVIVGRIFLQSDYRSPELKVATDPLNPYKTTTIPKNEIESHTRTSISAMPKGLLNTLNEKEILDLLAYIESGGNRNHPIWRAAE